MRQDRQSIVFKELLAMVNSGWQLAWFGMQPLYDGETSSKSTGLYLHANLISSGQKGSILSYVSVELNPAKTKKNAKRIQTLVDNARQQWNAQMDEHAQDALYDVGTRDIDQEHTAIEEPCHEVDVTIIAVIPEFGQAKAKDKNGNMYAITAKTNGVRFDRLQEGWALRCTVDELPRVLSATILKQ